MIPYFSNNRNHFHIVIMLKIGETKATKEKFFSTKIIIKVWDVSVDNKLF